MLIVYTWHRGNIKALVILHAIDKSSIHRRLFANVVLGLAANKSKWLCIMVMLFIPRSPNTIFAEGLPKHLQSHWGRWCWCYYHCPFRSHGFPKHCKPGECHSTAEKCQCCSSWFCHLHTGRWQNFFFHCANIHCEKFLWVKTNVGRKKIGVLKMYFTWVISLIRLLVQLLKH